MATSSTSCTTRTENSGVRPTCDCGRSTDLVVGCLLGQVESASNPSVTNDNRGLHSPLVGAWWVTTKIGTSIGCPSFHPFAMSKVRRPLTMAIGLLFGLGLDTAAEIGVLVLVGAGVATGLPRYAVLVLPLLFVAGMDPDRVRRCAQSAGPVPTNPSV